LLDEHFSGLTHGSRQPTSPSKVLPQGFEVAKNFSPGTKGALFFILANSQLFPLRRVILYTSAKQKGSNETLIQFKAGAVLAPSVAEHSLW
jgi:hypothetical protein